MRGRTHQPSRCMGRFSVLRKSFLNSRCKAKEAEEEEWESTEEGPGINVPRPSQHIHNPMGALKEELSMMLEKIEKNMEKKQKYEIKKVCSTVYNKKIEWINISPASSQLNVSTLDTETNIVIQRFETYQGVCPTCDSPSSTHSSDESEDQFPLVLRTHQSRQSRPGSFFCTSFPFHLPPRKLSN